MALAVVSRRQRSRLRSIHPARRVRGRSVRVDRSTPRLARPRGRIATTSLLPRSRPNRESSLPREPVQLSAPTRTPRALPARGNEQASSGSPFRERVLEPAAFSTRHPPRTRRGSRSVTRVLALAVRRARSFAARPVNASSRCGPNHAAPHDRPRYGVVGFCEVNCASRCFAVSSGGTWNSARKASVTPSPTTYSRIGPPDSALN